VEADEMAKRRRRCMIRVAITAARHAISSTLPEDVPLQRREMACLVWR